MPNRTEDRARGDFAHYRLKPDVMFEVPSQENVKLPVSLKQLSMERIKPDPRNSLEVTMNFNTQQC